MMKKKVTLPVKNAAEQENTPKRSLIKRIFTRSQGGLKTGWMLVCALIIHRGVSFAVRLCMGSGFAALFSAWRVNAENIHRAPGWARGIYSWHASFITVAVCIISIPVAVFLRRWWIGKDRRIKAGMRSAVLPAVSGISIAVVSPMIFLLIDSMRLEWPLSRPELSLTVFLMLPVTLLTAFSEELFTKCVVYDGVSGRKGPVWATAVSTAVFFLLNGGYWGNAVSAINVLLMGIVCCMFYERRGLWASVLFRGMWSYFSVFVLGTGVSGPVYAMYRVSDAWLTGGDGGLIYGIWMTAVFAGMMAAMNRNMISRWFLSVKKKGEDRRK